MKPPEPPVRRPKGTHPAGAVQYRLSQPWIKAISAAPILITLGLTALSLPVFLGLHPYIWGENKLVENTQFGVYTLGAIQSLVLAWQAKKQVEKPLVWGFYLVVGLGLTFIALEEVAWGQQFLGFRSPAFMKEINVQNEFTFHNVGFLQDHTDILNLLFGLGGLVGLWAASQSRFQKIGVPPVLTSWFGMILLLGAFGAGADLLIAEKPVNYSIHIQTETAELLIAIAGFLYAWLNGRALVVKQPRSTVIKDLRVEGDAVIMTTQDDRVIQLPAQDFPGLASLPPGDRGVLRITKGGTALQGTGPEVEIPVPKLLASLPAVEAVKALGPFPLPLAYPILALVAGLVSMGWLAIIPGDAKNAWLLGLSRTRLLMFVSGAAILAAIGYGLWRSSRDSAWAERVSRRLNDWLVRPAPWRTSSPLRATVNLRALALVAALGAAGSAIFLGIAITRQDPYSRGILIRLAPWAFWGLVACLETLVLAMTKLLAYGRLEMAHATGISFTGECLEVSLADQRCVSIPLDRFPRLHQATPQERQDYTLSAGGLRICWPGLGEELCSEQLLTGVPPLENYRAL
jgi:hypothetical protein